MKDEKTIPLSAYLASQSQEVRAKLDSSLKAWGDDFHYRALFEQSDDCIFIISFGLRYMAANPQALNLLGYPESELIGKPVRDVMALDESLGREAVLDDHASLFERILRRKDGSEVPVEISTSIVYDETGKPAYIQSIARDITNRKEAEQALRSHDQVMVSISDATTRLLQLEKIENKIAEALESLGQTIGAVSCFVIEIDHLPNGNSITVPSAWKKGGSSSMDISHILAPFKETILSRTAGIFTENIEFPPAQSVAVLPIAGKADQQKFLGLLYPEKVEVWLPAQLDAVQIAANLIGAALQRNQYEQAILASEARNRTIIDALPDLIIRLDANGTILDYNAQPDHPLYQPDNAATGKLLSAIWPEEIVSHIIDGNIGDAFTKPHHLKEFTLPFSNRTYESRLAPITPQEALLVVRDITEQAKLNEMKSDFINRASHELRTPLTTVIMMTNLIQEGGTEAELQEYWHVLNNELGRQKTLIDRLLIAGRLESGTMLMTIAPLDLTSILDDSILAVKPIAQKKNIRIQFSAPTKPILVLGDKSGLQEVFVNLINNAAKFSPEGSSVDVDVKLTDKEAQAAIVDHGMGIPPEDLPHLCERFFRGKNVTIAEVPGSGIGLFIVKSIVEELDGKLKVESTLKQGTTFTVTLRRPEALVPTHDQE